MFLSSITDESNSSPDLPVHSILNAITDAVIVADDQGIIRYVNRAVQTLFGYREVELLGQDLAVLMPDPHRRQHPEYIRRLRETPASSIINLRREAVGQRSDTTVFPIDLHVGSYQADGRPMFVGIVTDISLRKQAQQQFDAHTKALEASNFELNEMRLAAEAANQAKSSFLANMSHEIRTPMTAILGYADLLASANLDSKERREAVNAISRNGRHLVELLSDILDLSKIEADRLEIEWIPCDVLSLVEDMVSMLRVKAREKGLTLTVEYRGEIPRLVRTDPTRLRQILLNLLGNAIKFTERGGVRIVVTGQAVADPDCELEFKVIDTGIGIESAQLARLFQPFAQADSSLTRRFGGTGLGLIISRRLAQLLGGDVAVRSTYGEGSVFSLKLRVPRQPGACLHVAPCEAVRGSPQTTSISEPDLQGCQVLLVEDGPDN